MGSQQSSRKQSELVDAAVVLVKSVNADADSPPPAVNPSVSMVPITGALGPNLQQPRVVVPAPPTVVVAPAAVQRPRSVPPATTVAAAPLPPPPSSKPLSAGATVRMPPPPTVSQPQIPNSTSNVLRTSMPINPGYGVMKALQTRAQGAGTDVVVFVEQDPANFPNARTTTLPPMRKPPPPSSSWPTVVTEYYGGSPSVYMYEPPVDLSGVDPKVAAAAFDDARVARLFEATLTNSIPVNKVTAGFPQHPFTKY